MAKIIKKGRDHIWIKELECTGKGITGTGCGAILEINESDLFKVYGGGYTENIPYAGIRCPACSCDTCLDDMKIEVPSSIFKKIPDRVDWLNKYKIPKKEDD